MGNGDAITARRNYLETRSYRNYTVTSPNYKFRISLRALDMGMHASSMRISDTNKILSERAMEVSPVYRGGKNDNNVESLLCEITLKSRR